MQIVRSWIHISVIFSYSVTIDTTRINIKGGNWTLTNNKTSYHYHCCVTCSL